MSENDIHELTYDHLHGLCSCLPTLHTGDEARDWLNDLNRCVDDEAFYYGVRHRVVFTHLGFRLAVSQQ